MMEYTFSWEPDYLAPVLTIGLTTMGFILYWFIAKSDTIKSKLIDKYGEEKTSIYYILFQKYTGVLFLGILPTIIVMIFLPFSFGDYGLNFNNPLNTLFWILGLGLIIVFLNFLAARNPDNYKIYPQIRIKKWSGNLILINTVTWICYLFAYEFLFRGVLLFACIPALGIWPAIAVNTTIYSCTHIPKGRNEAIAAIPFGIILCMITISTGNIWTAFFAHVFLAVTNDYFSLYFNPEMKIVK